MNRTERHRTGMHINRLLRVALIAALLSPIALSAHTARTDSPRKDDVKTIVSKTKKLYSGTKKAKINFSQSGDIGDATGTLEYSTGNKFRLTLPTQTIVSNGSKTWTYIQSRNQVVINKAATDGQVTPNDILRSFPGNYGTTLNGSATVNGADCWIVECKAGSGSKVGDITNATLYIDKSTYRFQKITVQSPTLGTSTLTISSGNYNATIADSRFTFTAPKDAKVIDLTK